MGRLQGRVAIITGAGRGIGRATAMRLAEEGAKVVVNDVDPEPAEETAQAIKEAGGEALVSTENTVDLEAARAMAARTVESLGSIDILINNAGITRDKTFHNLDDKLWDFVLDVNLRTAFHSTLAVVGHMRDAAKAEMKEQGAPAFNRKITFTTSVAALVGNAGQANYTTAKSGAVGLMKTLARELGPFQINVNAVAPGFIETRLTQAKQGEEDMGIPEHIRGMALMLIALGRYGQPEDVANAHLFLASQESNFISEVVLPVSGGQLGA